MLNHFFNNDYFQFSEECGLDAVERGIAAMPFFSLINHSCNPNILRHSRSNCMIIYVMYPIKKGEQVYIYIQYIYIEILAYKYNINNR